MSLRLLLAGLQEFLVQKVIRVFGIEHDVVAEVGVGMNPDGIFARLKHTAEDGSQ